MLTMALIVWGICGVAVTAWASTQRTDAGYIGALFLGVLPWLAAGVLLLLWVAAKWLFT